MRTMNFDAIATAAPLNRTASTVRDGSGDAYEGRVPVWHEHWTAPPLPETARPAHVEDLTGRSFGRMKVVRYHRKKKNQTGHQWLVRCICGDYEVRRTRAIFDASEAHVCQSCDWFRHVKWMRENEGRGTTLAKSDSARLDAIASGAIR